MALSDLQTKKWRKVRLGEVADIQSGGTPSSSKQEYWDNGTILWATLPDLRNKYLYNTTRKITELGLKKSSAKILPINTVIYSSRATLGEISITKKETTTNQGSKNFICDSDKIFYEFLYYLLRSKKEEINNHATGATYKEINKTTFANLEVFLPSIIEQKDIAQVLSAYDDKIANNEKRIQILESILQKTFIEWFIKNSPINNETSLKSISDIFRGKSYSSEDIKDENGVPFVNLKCINRYGGFRYDGLKSYSGTYKDGHVVKNGDIVIAVTDMTQERMLVARSARIPILDGGKGVISMDLVKIEPKKGTDKTWLYCFLRYSGFGENLKEYANGANVLHLNPARIAEYKLNLPNIERQELFSSIANPLIFLQEKLSVENRNLQQARDFLIPQLVNGKITLKEN